MEIYFIENNCFQRKIESQNKLHLHYAGVKKLEPSPQLGHGYTFLKTPHIRRISHNFS